MFEIIDNISNITIDRVSKIVLHHMDGTKKRMSIAAKNRTKKVVEHV